MRKSIAILLIFAESALLGQTSVLSVKDAINQKPIEFAHVVFFLESGKRVLKTTNPSGILEVEVTNPTPFYCTFVGYATLRDTLYPGVNKSIALQPGNFGLDEVVVTGQLDPVTEKNSVYKVKVINSEQITHRGAVTLNQVLNDQLNIRIGQDNALGSTINVQGLGGENVKILIDGVPIVGRQDGNIDLSQLNLDNVERIEIIEGPLSVAYGASAIAGTLNLITKKPKENLMSASVKGLYESVGLTNLNGSFNLGFDKQAVRVNVGRNFFGGWDPDNEGRNQQWNQKEQILGSLGYQFAVGKSTWDLSLQGIHEVIKDKGDRLSDFSDNALDSWFTTNRTFAKATYSLPISEKHVLNASFTHNYFWRSKITYNQNLVDLTQEVTPNPDDHDTTLFTGINGRVTWPIVASKRWIVQPGVDLNYETGEGGRISEGTRTMGDYALFTSAEYKYKSWTLQPGLRWAYNTGFDAPLVPSLFAKYNFSDRWMMRATYAMGFRAPSLKELYMEFIDANHNIIGNQNLTPERSQNASLNFQWTWTDPKGIQSAKIEPSVFYNYITDNITLLQIQGTQFTYQNVEELETFGIKLMGHYTIHPDYHFKLGYSHLGFTNQDYTLYEGTDPYLYTPEVIAGFDYWRASKKFNFNITYKFTGATPGYALGNSGEVIQTSIPGYHWLDISATQKFWKNRLSVTLGGKNLCNVTNLQTSASTGGAHSGSGSQPISWGRTAFISCKLSL